MKAPATRLDYGQYLLVSQINSTLTNFADYGAQCRDDAINRYLRGERMRPCLGWDNGRGQLVLIPRGYGLCDDTGLDKHGSLAIELVHHQDSGNAKVVIKGIGVGTWGSVNPETD